MRFNNHNYFVDSSGEEHYTHNEIIQGIKALQKQVKAAEMEAKHQQCASRDIQAKKNREMTELKKQVKEAMNLLEDAHCDYWRGSPQWTTWTNKYEKLKQALK